MLRWIKFLYPHDIEKLLLFFILGEHVSIWIRRNMEKFKDPGSDLTIRHPCSFPHRVFSSISKQCFNQDRGWCTILSIQQHFASKITRIPRFSTVFRRVKKFTDTRRLGNVHDRFDKIKKNYYLRGNITYNASRLKEKTCVSTKKKKCLDFNGPTRLLLSTSVLYFHPREM